MLIVVVLVLALTGMTRADHWHPAKKYTVNLDAKPEERWSELARQHAGQMKTLCAEMMKMIKSTAPDKYIVIDDNFALDEVPDPYREELLGIMKAANLSTTEVLLMNSVYEIAAFEPPNAIGATPNVCTSTSIITQTLNDKIYHARNMDYPFTSLLKNLTIQVDFVENGEVSYTGTTFVGYVGLLTGQRPHRFTLTLNQRSVGNWSMDLLRAMVMRDQYTCSLLIRDTLAFPSHDFNSAVNDLYHNPVLNPAYIVVGGVSHNQGAVITKRSVSNIIDVWLLGSNQTWFLVETNSDHWKQVRDDRRREAARGTLRAVGRANLTSDPLWEVLSLPGVRNPRTVYSVVMSAAEPGLYTTRVWD